MHAGKGYEMQLRREADAAEPTKLHKRKHQLHSLWHASKVKVGCPPPPSLHPRRSNPSFSRRSFTPSGCRGAGGQAQAGQVPRRGFI